MRKTLLALVAATSLIGGCAGFIRERIYRPEPITGAVTWPAEAPRQVTARTADGLDLGGYYWAPEAGSGDIILFFHGNGGNRNTAARVAEPLRRNGKGLLVASYRGYGDNPGRPTEAGLFADGAAFIALARRLQPEARLFLVGWSMGGAVALELASRVPVDGVVTIGTFTRLADVAPGIARGFLPDRFDNLAAIGRVRAPVFLFHGTQDAIVPYAHAARLRTASGNRATVVTMNGLGHHFDFARIAAHVWRALEGKGPPAE
jgi:hypothetical protein